MIYITGDIHADITRFKRFKSLLPKYRHYLLVCGDFGFVWDGSEQEKRVLKKLERYDCNIMFVEGTHDNIERLQSYPEESFCSGKVRRIGKNIFWLKRGEIYDINGVKVFAMGGGESTDSDSRIEGVTWWPGEMPDEADIAYARQSLDRAGNAVDIVITHQNPRIELGLIDANRERINALTAFLGETAKTLSFKKWYFGAQHVDKALSPKMAAVFEKVIEYKP